MREFPLNLLSAICVAVILLGLSSTVNSMGHTDKNATRWISVRMNDIHDSLTLQKELDLIQQGDWSSISSSSIALLKPIGIRQLLPPYGRGSKSGATTARDELALYFSVQVAPGTDIGLAVDLLRTDRTIMHAEPVLPIEMFSSSCEEIDANDPIPIITGVAKDWHLEVIDAPSAWNIQTGHATVGIADTGAYSNHPALMDFNGINYNGGNLHSEFAFQVGDRSSGTSFGSGHPFEGKVFFGHIDEVEYKIDPNNGVNCGYSSTLDFRRAGHGTHVAGLIAARETGFGKPSGTCPSCPILMGSFTFPWTSPYTGQCAGAGQDPWTNAAYDVGHQSQDLDSVFSTIAFLADMGAQVINFSGALLHH